MLFSIIKDERFLECMKLVGQSYWPYGLVSDSFQDYASMFRVDGQNLDEISKKTRLKIEEFVTGKCSDATHGFYYVIEGQNQIGTVRAPFGNFHFLKSKRPNELNLDISKVKPELTSIAISSRKIMPFLERFHLYFFERQWNTPYMAPHLCMNDLFNLIRSKDPIDNFSKNSGNYFHFLNVVAAMAHLIHFFSQPENFDLIKADAFPKDKSEVLCDILKYDPNGDQRTFLLMMAAFYHDIGKTIVDHRHAMEGAMILSNYPSQVLYYLKEISASYTGINFEQTSLLYIADLLYFHDLYGTLSTGENSYLKLTEVMKRLYRYGDENDSNRYNDFYRHIFDLWLLNLADIIVSISNKYELQDWVEKPFAEKETDIRSFLGDQLNPIVPQLSMEKDHGNRLKHDLKLTYLITDTFSSRHHAEYLDIVEKKLYEEAGAHAIERIRRLIQCCFSSDIINIAYKKVIDFFPNFKSHVTSLRNGDQTTLYEYIPSFFEGLNTIPDMALNKTIDNSIKSLGDFREFCKRFSWVGQMDYSLGFFKMIAGRALRQVLKEMIDPVDTLRTGWINDKKDDFINRTAGNIDKGQFLDKINAFYFVDNFVISLIYIINYLLFRERYFQETVRDLEFKNSSERLTPEKIDKILFFEGPARASRATMLTMETIFIY